VREVPLWKSPLGLCLALVVFGYAGLLILAPIWAILDGALADGLGPVQTALSDPQVIHALQLSLELTLLATAFNLVFGVIVAWVLTRQEFAGKRLLDALLDIPFVFAPVIMGYSLIVIFGRGGWIDAPIAIVFALPGIFLGKVFVSLPFVARSTQPLLSQMPKDPEEAAYTLGASPWRSFWAIVLPYIWTGVLYGVVLTFARAIGEFGAAAVVSGGIEGKTETATMFIYRALLDRNRIGAYSVALVLGAMAMLILFVMNFLKRLLSASEERQHVHSTEDS
jgi:sulfate transport system permease protein